jgi:hypothetical protein
MLALDTYPNLFAQAAVGFIFVSAASADLAIDCLGVLPHTLRRWPGVLAAAMIQRHAAETRPWQRRIRRAIGCSVIAVVLLVALGAWLPIQHADAVTKGTATLLVASCLGWFVYLYKLPRGERPNS